MRAAEMKQRPGFPLMKQTGAQTACYMQMPRWLFSDPRYADMSLDAKVAYTFLLSRFQLSCKNGWVNEFGEVFVIFPRKELARELRVCEQRVTAALKRLAELKLVWEKRCGRGSANQIYLAQLPEEPSAPAPEEGGSARPAKPEAVAPGGFFAPNQEPQKPGGKSRKSRGPKAAKPAAAKPQKPRPSNIKSSQTDFSYPDVSQPVSAGRGDGQADEERELMEILDACELHCFAPEVARVFENAIERLFYLDRFRIGGATLPQSRVRARLRLLDVMILRDAERKLRANLDREVKNSTAYTMAAIFNCISESESDLLVDPELNRISAPPRRW